MKLTKWCIGALACTLFAACSDNDLPGKDNDQFSGEESVSGYVALKINLPQTPSTRAGEDTNQGGALDKVDFQDGEDWEYNVANATLLFFTTQDNADGEDKAVFVSSKTLNRPFAPTGDSDNNISASSVEAVPITVTDANKDAYLWAMVMLNVPNNFVLPTANQTFDSYRKTTIDKTTEFINLLPDPEDQTKEKNYIFMTNAPLSDNTPGGLNKITGTPKIQTLVKLGKINDKVKNTIAEARDEVAGCIYVERAVAKISATIAKDVKIELPLHNATETNTPKITVDVANSSFGILNMNPKSYLIRNVKDFPTLTEEANFSWDMASDLVNTTTYTNRYYRMIGNTPMPGLYDPLHLSTQLYYRTYWCVDPNYESPMWTEASNRMDTPTNGFKTIGSGQFYVKENTFTVKNQSYGNSTHVVFKVQIQVNGENKDLFILNDNHGEIYVSEEDVTSKSVNYILNQQVVKDALTKSMKEGASYPDGEELAKFLKVKFVSNAKGVYVVNDILLDDSADDFNNYYDSSKCQSLFKTALGGDEGVQSLAQRVNLLFVIEKYVGGVSYYMVPIQHFGESSTPWTKSGENQMNTGDTYKGSVSYKYDAQRYLGRYGLVRNNWYEIDATSFSGIGRPVIPSYWDEKDTSNDNNEVKQYIGVETHILSWAKRVQHKDF